MRAPRIDLDWEEGIFRALMSLWRRLAPEPESPPKGAAFLADHIGALRTLAQLVAAEPIRLLEARGVGGARGRDLLLPPVVSLSANAEANRDFYVLRTVISAAIRRVTRDATPELTGPAAPLESLRVAREAVNWLSRELPRFAALHRAAAARTLELRPDPETLHGRERALERARHAALRGESPWEQEEVLQALHAPSGRGPRSEEVALWGAWIPPLEAPPDTRTPEERPPEQIESEQAAPAVEELRRVTLDPREREDAVLIHTFEKVETLDSYRGGARDTDGADELETHAEALEEVELGDLVRSDDQAHAVLRADLQMGLDVPDVEAESPTSQGIAYDEWDQRRRSYRRDWCTVYPGTLRRSKPVWAREAEVRHRRLIHELRRRLEIHRSGLRPRSRQLDGEDVDLAALVDAHADRRAGRDGGGRLYVRQQRRRRDFATTVLLDVSLSTDSWVAERRVLDVARDAVFVLGDVADQLGDRLQILTFASHTRNRCHVWEVKGWRDSWRATRGRLGALEPRGYTRIGPALRHATDRLAAEPAERRLLLLVSDGKPTDYDRYEGRYGIADVRQALREAERRGVSAHALAVDAVARDYLPPMFGPGAWHILRHPGDLPELLSTVYGRLTAR